MIKYLMLIISVLLFSFGYSMQFPDTGWVLKGSEGTTRYYSKKKPVVALVLSGGGSRGFAHIGVLKALEREGIEPDIVVGTSMGSVIGGLYASGVSPEDIEQMAETLEWNDIFSDIPPRSDKLYTQKKDQENHIFQFRFSGGKIVLPTAFSSGQFIINLLLEKTIGRDYDSRFNFDKYPRRFRAMATDLLTSERVIIKDGCLAEAMRASLAVPFVFSPFRVNGRMLVDGGFTNILPMDVALEMGADVIIAVHVRPVLYTEQDLSNPIAFIDQIVAICLTNQDRRPDRDSGIIISPILGRHMPQDFTEIPNLIKAGEKGIEDHLPEIRKKLMHFNTEEMPQESLKIQNARIEGLNHIQPDRVYPMLDKLVEKRVSMSMLNESVGKIYNTGYFDSIHVELNPVPAGNALVIHVKENPLVRRIKFTGCTQIPKERIEGVFSQKKGEPISFVAIKAGKDAIKKLYSDSGFVLARVDTLILSDSGCEVVIDEGRIKKIEIVGNVLTKESIIRREIGLMKGRVFSIRQMQQDVRNLYATGFFDYVYIDIDQNSEPVTLKVNLKEKPFEAFQLGVRFDNIRMLEGFLGFKSLNFGGRGFVLNSLVQYGLQREKYLLGVSSDRLFHTYLAADGKVFYYRDRKYVVDPLDSTRFEFNALGKIGTMASLAQQISKIGRLSYVFLLEHYKSNQKENALGPINNYDKGVRIFSLRTEFDTYDNPSFPTKGYNLFSSADIGLDVLGRHNAFTEFTLTTSGAISTFKRQAILPAFYISMADVSLPDAVKNYLGGATELRMNDKIVFYNSFPLYGFEEQSFTGDYLMVLRLGYRFELFKSGYLTMIFNMGQTWGTDNFQWSLLKQGIIDDSYKGVGASFSIDVPRIGPASFTASYPVFSNDEKQSSNALKLFYFSIGHDF